MLVPAGHAPNGKIYYQELCQRLAKRGYVVLAWDPVGQGERSQFWDAKAGKSRYNLICAEHAVMGNLAYLAGTNLARWEIWDGIRAVDYLLTRPEVDGERISIVGTSGGGSQAAQIAALDKRIKVVVPSCYITALPMRMFNRIFADPDSDPEQDLFGMISNGVDHAGLLLLMYPRPGAGGGRGARFFPDRRDAQDFSRNARNCTSDFIMATAWPSWRAITGINFRRRIRKRRSSFWIASTACRVRHGLPAAKSSKTKSCYAPPAAR